MVKCIVSTKILSSTIDNNKCFLICEITKSAYSNIELKDRLTLKTSSNDYWLLEIQLLHHMNKLHFKIYEKINSFI